jgi:hypothetical protein
MRGSPTRDKRASVPPTLSTPSYAAITESQPDFYQQPHTPIQQQQEYNGMPVQPPSSPQIYDAVPNQPQHYGVMQQPQQYYVPMQQNAQGYPGVGTPPMQQHPQLYNGSPIQPGMQHSSLVVINGVVYTVISMALMDNQSQTNMMPQDGIPYQPEQQITRVASPPSRAVDQTVPTTPTDKKAGFGLPVRHDRSIERSRQLQADEDVLSPLQTSKLPPSNAGSKRSPTKSTPSVPLPEATGDKIVSEPKSTALDYQAPVQLVKQASIHPTEHRSARMEEIDNFPEGGTDVTSLANVTSESSKVQAIKARYFREPPLLEGEEVDEIEQQKRRKKIRAKRIAEISTNAKVTHDCAYLTWFLISWLVAAGIGYYGWKNGMAAK